MDTSDDNSPRSKMHRLFMRIARESGAAIMASTVPIYRDVNADIPIDFDRTGLLFRIGTESFLLTTAHHDEPGCHIGDYLKKGVMFYVDVSRNSSTPIPLVDCKFYSTEVDNCFPDRDLVAIHLDQDAVDQFYPQRRFLTLADCDLNADPKPAHYLAAGFPSDTYHMTPVVGGPAMFFIGDVNTNPRMANFDPQVHLALALDGYGLRATDHEFVADAIPEFHGMSGCGIWRVAPIDLIEPDSWMPSKVRLVAIQNRSCPNSHATGTWMKHAVNRIVDELPQLKQITQTHYAPGY